MTTRNHKVFKKQSYDSSDNYKFPVTANETLSEKTTINAHDQVWGPADSDEMIFFF